MNFLRSIGMQGLALAAVGGVALSGLAGPALAQQPREFVNMSVQAPERTDAGTWGGTWVYINRDYKMAFWFRGEESAPELRVRLLNTKTGEGFESDWMGLADYVHAGRPGIFSLALGERDDKTLKGDWHWRRTSGMFPEEWADVTFYRTGFGRQLVLVFENMERRRGQSRVPFERGQVWVLRKASKGLALWEELPF